MASSGHNKRRIPTPVVPDKDTRFLKFSLKYLDIGSSIFGLHECSNDFLIALLLKIKEYSSWPLDMFMDPNNEEFRHQIHFPDTSCPGGFTNVNLEQLAWEEAWQFGLASRGDWQKGGWRVHGILLDDTFFVIWLDPNHVLYPL